MLNRHNLEIAKLASKATSRFTLHGIQISPERTAETDGKQLVTVTTPKTEWPAGAGSVTRTFKPFILGARDAVNLARELPKRSTLHRGCVAVATETDDNGSAVLLTANDDIPRRHEAPKMTGNFPDIDRVIPKREHSTFRIRVNAKRLGDVLAQIAKFQADSHCQDCELSFTSSSDGIRIDARNDDGQELTAVVMPVRMPKRHGEVDKWKPERPEWAGFHDEFKSF